MNQNIQNSKGTIAIIGGGPCGLGAAVQIERLRRLGKTAADYVVIDSGVTPGGYASSVEIGGFTFDYGGHVLYPHKHYQHFGSMLDGLDLVWERTLPVRGVMFRGELIPAPVQRNLHRLPTGEFLNFLTGALLARMRKGRAQKSDLGVFLDATFGTSMSTELMRPLNEKMWAARCDDLGCDWVTHRAGSRLPNIPDVDVGRALGNLLLGRDDLAWGDGQTVPYPSRGGAGAVWRQIAGRLPSGKVLQGQSVVGIDDNRRTLTLGDGRTIDYDYLISTMPLDTLIRISTGFRGLGSAANELIASSAVLVGFGVVGYLPPRFERVHSFHVPNARHAFWRVSFPSNFSSSNAPNGCYSVLVEVSRRRGERPDMQDLIAQTRAGLCNIGVLPSSATITTVWSEFLEHGYPIPFLGRDEVLGEIQETLGRSGILSRGRFGGWRYEVSNQDHAYMQGVEAVNSILCGEKEETYSCGHLVNR